MMQNITGNSISFSTGYMFFQVIDLNNVNSSGAPTNAGTYVKYGTSNYALYLMYVSPYCWLNTFAGTPTGNGFNSVNTAVGSSLNIVATSTANLTSSSGLSLFTLPTLSFNYEGTLYSRMNGTTPTTLSRGTPSFANYLYSTVMAQRRWLTCSCYIYS